MLAGSVSKYSMLFRRTSALSCCSKMLLLASGLRPSLSSASQGPPPYHCLPYSVDTSSFPHRVSHAVQMSFAAIETLVHIEAICVFPYGFLFASSYVFFVDWFIMSLWTACTTLQDFVPSTHSLHVHLPGFVRHTHSWLSHSPLVTPFCCNRMIVRRASSPLHLCRLGSSPGFSLGFVPRALWCSLVSS